MIKSNMLFYLNDAFTIIFIWIYLQLVEEDLRSLIFGDYMNPDLEPEDRVYAEVPSINEFYTVAEQCLDEYNNTHKTRMNLVIFR